MKYTLPILLSALCLYACHPSNTATQTNSPSSDPSHSDHGNDPVLPNAILQQQSFWRSAFNDSNPEKLTNLYADGAGLVIIRDFLQHPEEITEELSKLRAMIGKLENPSIQSVVKHDEKRYFEMGQFQLRSDTVYPYAYLTAWKEESGIWLRELDILDHMVRPDVDLQEIDQARALWQERSNAHDHDILVAQSYASNGYYFNRGQVYRGTKAISEVFSYMSRPDWQITLTPLSVLPVTEELVYELGQYQSSGVGHYVIIWEKHDDVNWRVRLDFNF